MTPAHQNGQEPTGAAPPCETGQANSFVVPWTVNSSPMTIRKMPSTGEW